MSDPTPLPQRLAMWRAAYANWGIERSRLTALESTADGPASANEWQWSDDHAVELLREAADLIPATDLVEALMDRASGA